ncbi:2,3-diaminopropionate biosynthesis protein SbnA [Bacillus cereus BAG1X2-3]|uniref:2,3-diaminopropionate biosynthesis protein SbnA n=1 Tax=Bacillus cereus TaxID=1396 RepID=A0A9X7HJI2_BACCE|nr:MULTISPECIES: 2,3-diaminopropionate biosynthesis protein SbnA [Bacillus cereus group]EOO24468.1 2,3-diaminopropionate biosynthesis protein SbnA [Bacillus cereus BAG1X1-1]EOO43230.1 2,3-diaminopropionate biosynthesis protein SbnA [Bacillus cereus BAG1X2-1]EOO45599.1 2,3-diaminopropionate biosynthesis protein SbnA [Bacillus cereus BAG1X2-2]EOO62192.1 2,3-diaminopropionate biosynthesis protein SbnA [Bacillus cereus BAG1X2-3]EOP01095.1 2,3-diaminopropionate biosynthesis protein SbnA [Bacillus c
MIHDDVLSLIGDTPIVKINKLVPPESAQLYVKLEGFNPGGSSKDRVAKRVIEYAENSGQLKPGGTIVESSSGNLAIGLALVAKMKGYKMICVVDPKISKVNLNLIKSYGAQVHMVDVSDEHGNYLKARLVIAQDLANSIDGAYWPNQYNNPENPEAYVHTLVQEIYDDFNDTLDWIVCPVGTAGLITGVAKGMKKLNPSVKVMAVDAVGSVIFGGKPGVRRLLGIGNAIVPGNVNRSLYDDLSYVNDADSFFITRELVSKEGILVGGSSGAVVCAALRLIDKLPKSKKVLAILPDRGDRYYNTIFSDEWLDEHDIELPQSIYDSILV